MVFYHSVEETLVSEDFGRCGRDSEHLRSGEYSPFRTGLTETLNIEHQLERENFEVTPSKSSLGKKFESFQRQPDFQDQMRDSAKSRSDATTSLTKLNPWANPFIPKPIEWDKLPLRPLDPNRSPSFDLDFDDRSDRSPIDEDASFDSSDVMFMQPYPLDVSSQQTRAFSFPEYEPRDQQQISGIDQHIFQDSAIFDSQGMIHNFPSPTEKISYTEKKCYHCGSVGHVAIECYMKKKGFDAVCFHCFDTGHKTAKCPKRSKKEEIGIVETNSPVMYKSDYLNQDSTLKASPAKVGDIDIGGRTWNRNSNLHQQRTLRNERLFDQILALKI